MKKNIKKNVVVNDIKEDVVIIKQDKIIEPEGLKEANKGYSSFNFNTYLLGEVVVNYRGFQLISIFKDNLNVMNNICHYDYIEILNLIRSKK